MNLVYPWPILGVFVLAVLTLSILSYLILRIKHKTIGRKIVLLAAVYLTISLTLRLLLRGGFLYEVTSLPFFFFQDIVTVVIGLFVGWRLLANTGSEHTTVPDYSSSATLHKTIVQILDSEHFLTALRSTLPQGKDDQQFGLDYIPFMLHSIDERRRRAIKSARIFLIATVTSAVIFSMVVMYFGYILVNESSAGVAASLVDIKNSTQSLSNAANVLLPSYKQNPEYQRSVEPALERLETYLSDHKELPQRDAILSAISEAKISGHFVSLANTLRDTKVDDSETKGQQYSKELSETRSAILSFMASQGFAAQDLATGLRDLKVLIPKAEDFLSKPENRIPEIIKRLALGLVIATFFLALLRYLGGLYRTRYLQVLAAENDDFAVRRFYVAFKSSTASDDQRKAVLTGFMTDPNKPRVDSKEMDSDDRITKQQYELLKDLLGALSKKF